MSLMLHVKAQKTQKETLTLKKW